MIQTSQPLSLAFKNALNGLMFVLRTQRNARIHLMITLLVLLMGFFFKISSIQWIALIFAIGLVLSSECMNTGIEKLTDLASPDYHFLAKLAKDCAAASVLISSITALCIGLIIFIPRLLVLISSLS